MDKDWNVTSFNRAAQEITGIPLLEAIGRPCSEVFRSNMCGDLCPLQQTLENGRPVIGKAGYFINADGSRIPISISTAVLRDKHGKVIGGAETFRDLSEVEALRQELKGKFRVGDLTSRSPVMQRLFEILPAIAASPSTVLILGETGTGKELVARTLHELSPRSRGPFIAVNCGALPDSLLESELFGYKAGAFTGANKDKPGRFARRARAEPSFSMKSAKSRRPSRSNCSGCCRSGPMNLSGAFVPKRPMPGSSSPPTGTLPSL